MDNKNYKYTNRLINEASPYLLQHAHNPVDWYPWGEEAFNKAKKENKPIFLSIGYSTCHWCHVMERESFENEKIAEVFNKGFVCIKVDREERPDLDHIYMTYIQEMTGQGGWPMSVFLDTNLQPFYGGTYLPPEPRYNMPGIIDILNGVLNLYHEKKDTLNEMAIGLKDRVEKRENIFHELKGSLKEDIIEELEENLSLKFDSKYGGFSREPKFPVPHYLEFLLDYSNLSKDNSKEKSKENTDDKSYDKSYEMVFKTLESIYRGGIFDHVGGGISRYSVDKFWLIPHFEKMLYDNALILSAISKANLITKSKIDSENESKSNSFLQTMADRILFYLDDKLKSEEVLYYSAEDADSEGEEGKFYIFTEEEIRNALGIDEEEIKNFFKTYNVTPKGNFEGSNVLNLINSNLDVKGSEVEKYRYILNALYEVREKRIKPHKDDKYLFSWNSMIIKAFCDYYESFNDEKYLNKAVELKNTLFNKLVKDRRIHTSGRRDVLGPEGVLDDYAWAQRALIRLYEVTGKEDYLLEALSTLEDTEKLFKDEKGGYTLASKNSDNIIMNPVNSLDGAYISGNSLMAMNLYFLKAYTHLDEMDDLLNKQFDRFKGLMTNSPEHCVGLINAYLKTTKEENALITGNDKEDMEKVKYSLKEEGFKGTIQLVDLNSKLIGASDFLKEINMEDTELRICSIRGCSLPRKFNNIVK